MLSGISFFHADMERSINRLNGRGAKRKEKSFETTGSDGVALGAPHSTSSRSRLFCPTAAGRRADKGVGVVRRGEGKTRVQGLSLAFLVL